MPTAARRISLPRVLLRGMLITGRIPGRAGRLIGAVAAGLALRWLPGPRLRQLDELYYDEAELYRSDAWNEQGLFGWEHNALNEALPSGARVAVIGCGGGREVLALLRSGFEVLGFESHPRLADYASELLAARGFPGRVQPVPRDTFPALRGLDAAVVGWGALSLVSPRTRRLELLAQAARAVAPGGTLLVSGFGGRRHPRELALVHRLAGGSQSDAELGDTLAPNRVHVFTVEQLRAELTQVGWTPQSVGLVAAGGAPTGYVWMSARRA